MQRHHLPVTTAGATTASDDGGRVDDEILGELFELMAEGGGDGLVTAYEMFLSGVPARLSEIDTAVGEGRFDDAARGAHTLRGSAGSFGARRLSALTVSVEQHCREHDAGGAARVVGEMRDEFGVFRTILADRLSRLSR